MPALLLHLAVVDRLATDPQGLPPEIARALDQDLAYTRLGAAIADLPDFGGMWGGLESSWGPAPVAPFTRLFHARAPVTMGLKMAELVSNGALVSNEAGLAFVTGYFVHLCLDRQLHPLVDRLVMQYREADESPHLAHRRIEWAQALFFLREQHGRDLLGDSRLRGLFQVLKRGGPPARGVGRGLYELLRLSAQEALGEAPTKAEVDGWVRGLYLYGLALSSPLGKRRALKADSDLLSRELYRSSELDLPSEVERALDHARQVLTRLAGMIRRGTFSPRGRAKFLEEFPEGSIEACAA